MDRHQYLGACAVCWTGMRPLAAPACPGCALPAPPVTDLLGPGGGRCATCALDPPAWLEARAAVLYDDAARPFLLRAKLAGRPELLAALAAQLSAVIRQSGLVARCSLIVPVPSHPWSHLRRGFSPGPELARFVGRELRLPVLALLRRRPGAGQALKRVGGRRRKELVENAFRTRSRLCGECVLLVDDVLTTGATAGACAAALLDSGASGVRLGIWARTPVFSGSA